MKNITRIMMALVFMAASFTIFTGCDGGDDQEKINPIIMVHGAFFKDENLLGIDYWWGIPAALEEQGEEVYCTQQRTFGYSHERAEDLRKEIGYMYAANPHWDKINIIAHSQGPIDSRYLITHLDIPDVGPAKDTVLSLTSISGTHTGSEVADLLWALYAGLDLPYIEPIVGGSVGELIMWAVDAFAWIFYYNEEDQSSMNCLHGLTSKYFAEVFNPGTPNVPGVYYQSWAGKIVSITPDFYIAEPLWLIMYAMGAGDNDSLVSVNSSKWGNYRGEMLGNPKYGVSHFGEIGHFFGMTGDFDAPQFYVNVVKELRDMGY